MIVYRCVEGWVTVKMTHLLKRGHGKRFPKFMDGFLPAWRIRRDEPNGAALADEERVNDFQRR